MISSPARSPPLARSIIRQAPPANRGDAGATRMIIPGTHDALIGTGVTPAVRSGRRPV
jgi:hypothetical protein